MDTPRDTQTPQNQPRFHLRAFGLDIDSDFHLPGARPLVGHSPRTVNTLVDRAHRRAVVAPAERSRLRHTLSLPDGTEWMSVRESAAGYHVEIYDYGAHLVSPDGRVILSADEDRDDARRARFLLSHGLPIAATLHGYEVIHASAVARAGSAVAFVGPSGTGKTTLASRLVGGGDRLIADDALTLEGGADGPIAHPSAPILAVRPNETEGLAGRIGHSVGATDKIHFAPVAAHEPLALRVVYHLEAANTISIVPLTSGLTRAVLGLAFLPFLRTADRLDRHLELAQLLALRVPQFRLCSPRDGADDRLLSALEDHLRAQGLA